MHNLDEQLTYKRVQMGWTADELLEIPENLKLCKTLEEKEARIKAAREKRKATKEANQKINQKILEEKKTKKRENLSIIAH